MLSQRLPFMAGMLLLVAVSGCGSLADRFHDAAQVFDATATVGPGFNLGLRATEVAQLGVGSYHGKAAGLLEGRVAVVREERHEFGASLLHTYEMRRDGQGEVLDIRHPRFGDPGFREYPLSYQTLSDRQFFDLGGGMHLGYLGLNVTFRPWQLVDFVGGWFGADLARDDAHGRTREELVQQARSMDARERAAAFDALLRRGESYDYSIYAVPEVRTRAQRDAIEALTGDSGDDPN